MVKTIITKWFNNIIKLSSKSEECKYETDNKFNDDKFI